MQSKTILTCLDGSHEAEAALPYALAVATAERATVQLITVVDSESGNPLFWRTGEDTEWIEGQRQSAERYLDGKAWALRTQGLEASSLVTRGSAAEEILRAAEAPNVSMVVMATHGHGGVQRWVLGSVADKVMRMSHRPTLLVRAPDVLGPPATVALRRLALPLDGSPLAEEALAPAVELAQAAGAEVLLVRAEQWIVTSMSRWGGEATYVPNLEEMEEETAAMAQDYLAGVRQRLPASIRAKVFVLRGFAVQELEVFFDEQQIDLVVMTTHGRRGLPRLVLGSTADRLVRAGVPILLIHPAEASAGALSVAGEAARKQ